MEPQSNQKIIFSRTVSFSYEQEYAIKLKAFLFFTVVVFDDFNYVRRVERVFGDAKTKLMVSLADKYLQFISC